MLGSNIREIRKAQKISINNLSKLPGISLGYLSDLENGKATNPSLDKLQLIASALNCPVDELLSTTPTEDDINNWDKNLDDVNQIKQFDSAEKAMKFILSQKSVMAYGGFDINKLTDKDKIDFANDLLYQLKVLGYKYRRK